MTFRVYGVYLAPNLFHLLGNWTEINVFVSLFWADAYHVLEVSRTERSRRWALSFPRSTLVAPWPLLNVRDILIMNCLQACPSSYVSGGHVEVYSIILNETGTCLLSSANNLGVNTYSYMWYSRLWTFLTRVFFLINLITLLLLKNARAADRSYTAFTSQSSEWYLTEQNNFLTKHFLTEF